MKLKLFSVLALGGLITAGVACGDETGGEGGEGGSGGETTATTGTKGGTTTKTTGAGNTTTGNMTTGGAESCDDIGTCQGDSMTPDSGCVECAVLGTTDDFTDGGTCQDEYIGCYGTDANCTGGNADCCALGDCTAACDDANPNDPAGYWMCACGSADAASCDPSTAPDTTCYGAAPDAAIQAEQGWIGCVLDTCANSCG